MKVSLSAIVTLFASASAFAPSINQQRTVAFVNQRPTSLRMSDSEGEKGGALVPIKEETVEFTAGLLGGAAGLVVGGPLLAAVGAAAGNYISKMEGDASDVIQAVSKTSIQVFNYLAGLDKKYEVLSKAKKSLESALNKLKQQDSVDPDTVEKVEKALDSTTKKIAEINDEYDLVGGGMTALGVVGDLVEKAIKKASELNEEYKLTDKAVTSLKGAVDKAKSAAKDASSSDSYSS